MMRFIRKLNLALLLGHPILMTCSRKQSYRDIWGMNWMRLVTIADEIYYTQNSDQGTSREKDSLGT